jgi:hypothetical protein
VPPTPLDVSGKRFLNSMDKKALLPMVMVVNLKK